MNCPQCSGVITSDAKFCPNCGMGLKSIEGIECPACKAATDRASNYCRQCGASLNAENQKLQSGNENAAEMSIFRRLGPREYVEHLVSRGEALVSERRIVTTLFADVVASTALAEMLDPEDVTAIMNCAFEAMSEPVDHYEGTLMRLMGDGVLCLFGAPVAHEDDAVRACHASLEILRRIRAIAEHQASKYSLSSFNVRIGISTGLAVVGEVGTRTRAEYTAMGSSVNLAARLQHEAEPGTVLICDQTWRLAHEIFDGRDMGLVTVRGKSQPVHVFRVLSSKTATIEAEQESPLVGRDSELCDLKNLISGLEEKRGGVLCLTGEAGIGKSRLLREGRLALSPNSTWVDAHCHSYTRSMSYHSARSILSSLSGIDQTNSRHQARKTLWKSFDQLFSVNEQLAQSGPLPVVGGPDVSSYATLGYLLQVPLEPHEQEFITSHQADDLQHNIISSYRSYIELTAKLNPLVLVWDDIHWIDPQSQQILDELSRLADKLPLLLVIVSRPEPGPIQSIKERLREGMSDRFHDINLTALDEEPSALLLRNLLDVDAVPASLTMPILSAAEGNPFFLEEMSRALIDTGLLVRGDNGIASIAAPTKMEMPQSVQAAILSRIDRLSLTQKTVLQAASVIGRSFDREILAQILEPDVNSGDLDEALGVLESRRFIRQSTDQLDTSEQAVVGGPVPALSNETDAEDDASSNDHTAVLYDDRRFVFKQSMTAEVVYNSLLKSERKRVHRRVGEVMEKLDAGRIEDIAPTLAYHYDLGHVVDKSVKYLGMTGEQAVHVFALDQAQECFEKALLAAADTEDGVVAPQQLSQLNQGLGDVLHFRSEYDKALQHYREAVEFETDSRRRSALYRKMGKLLEKSGQYDTARESLEASLDELKEDFDLKEAGRSYAALCMVYYRLGDLDMAVELGNLAHLMNERNQDKLGSAQAHNNLGIVMAKRDDLVSAEIHYESARKVWEEIGDRYGLASCHNNLGLLAIDRKDWTRAIEHFHESQKLFEALSNRHGLARVYDNLSQVFYLQGDSENAQEYLEKGLVIMAEIGTGRDGLLPEMWQSGVW